MPLMCQHQERRINKMKQKPITIEEALKGKVEIKKFKRLVKEMYSGFPNYILFEKVEDIIKTENMRHHLMKEGFLTMESHYKESKEIIGYSLGINALPLVSAWETEKLTNKIRWFTVSIIILTIVLITLE